MRYVKLGRTGLDISAITLGCMSFGEPERGTQKWTIDEAASRAIIKQALDAGINFLDTANAYSAGGSEEIVGRAIKDMVPRDEIVLATKLFFATRPGPNGRGLSRKAIFAELDASLRRLQTDYVDVYQIHRWDNHTPIEETLEALNDVVRQGKARYIGASSMYAWQFAKALYTADLHGWTRFASMQDHYNLIYREEEREMLPLCADQGIGVIPWSPLARGRLTRPWDVATARQEMDDFSTTLYPDSDREIVERVIELAGKRGVSPAEIAMAWVLRNPIVSSPIVGVTKPEQLTQAINAVDVELDDAETAYLEEPYQPHPVTSLR
jgi:1-deoxyxylulose-5-phosphate synthase